MQETISMLSIDDKSLTTELDRAGYRKMGVIVKPAENFEIARKLLTEGEIDLIVVNLDYSQANPLALIRHFKSDKKTSEIPVVATSVQPHAKIRKDAIAAGADLFVEQPLPRQYFIERLKTLLEHQTRSDDRIEGLGSVEFEFQGKPYQCEIGDLSVSGLLIATNLDFDDGESFELQFTLPNQKKPIKAKGEVVRTIQYSPKHPERLAGVGVRFKEFLGDSEERLRKFVERAAGLQKDMKMVYYL